jgi:hypothetical protein
MSLGLAALIVWLFTASIGVYMLRTWVARGGLRRQRATGVGVPPAVVFGHASAALSGLTVWISYLISGWRPLAWIGVVLICTAISLGVGTVTVWTPYPVRPDPAPDAEQVAEPGQPGDWEGRQAAAAVADDGFTVTDEMIASLLAEPAPPPRQSRLRLLPLIPAVHGFAAVTTFLLTVTAALLPVR